MLHETLAAHRLAGFGAADLQDVGALRLGLEVVVEVHDADNLGARKLELVRHQRDAGVIDVAELVLQRLKDDDCRPVEVLQALDDPDGAQGVELAMTVQGRTLPGAV